MLQINQVQIEEKLNKFIWDFNVSDNISYNLTILFKLYESQQKSATYQRQLFNKPIAILIISIIEAIFFDWMCLLDGATSHFPKSISYSSRQKIKGKITAEKRYWKYVDTSTGEDRQFKQIKNYRFSEIIDFIKEFELFGNANESIYDDLINAAFLRNRIHIFNWFNNFEKKEKLVFTDIRVKNVENLLEKILDTMVGKYPRPW